MTGWPAFPDWAARPLALPDLARSRARDAFLDTVACLLAGLGTPAAEAAKGEGRAFHWAAAAHALDFDDYDRPSVGHPSAVLVPTILALGGSGADALAAYVAGLEAIDRMGECVNPEHYERGWHATATLGAIGAAVAAGRLTRLDGRGMLTAMLLAAGVASGLKAQFGSMAKPMNAGFAALHGTMAARLAASGADARPGALDAFARLCGPVEPRPLRPFGDPLAIEEYGLVVKLMPCCGYLGRILPAVVAMRPEDPAGIAAVAIEAPPRNARVIAYGLPETPDQARFSVPYTVAVALMHGAVRIGDFTPEAIRREHVLELARRVTLAETAAQTAGDLVPEDPDRIVITLRDGRRIERVAADLPGSPEMPASRDQLLAKLADCAAGRADPAPLADLLLRLEELPDIAAITEHLE